MKTMFDNLKDLYKSMNGSKNISVVDIKPPRMQFNRHLIDMRPELLLED